MLTPHCIMLCLHVDAQINHKKMIQLMMQKHSLRVGTLMEVANYSTQ